MKLAVLTLTLTTMTHGVRQTMTQIKNEKVGSGSGYNKDVRPNLAVAEAQGLYSGVNGSCPDPEPDRAYTQFYIDHIAIDQHRRCRRHLERAVEPIWAGNSKRSCDRPKIGFLGLDCVTVTCVQQ